MFQWSSGYSVAYSLNNRTVLKEWEDSNWATGPSHLYTWTYSQCPGIRRFYVYENQQGLLYWSTGNYFPPFPSLPYLLKLSSENIWKWIFHQMLLMTVIILDFFFFFKKRLLWSTWIWSTALQGLPGKCDDVRGWWGVRWRKRDQQVQLKNSSHFTWLQVYTISMCRRISSANLSVCLVILFRAKSLKTTLKQPKTSKRSP